MRMATVITGNIASECQRFKEFKEFLQKYQQQRQGSNIVGIGISADSSSGSLLTNGSAELRTRQSADFYNVNEDELPAEVLYCVWQQMQQKWLQCPLAFRLSIAKRFSVELIENLQNFKQSNDIIIQATTTTQAETTNTKDQQQQQQQYHLIKLQKYVVIQIENFFSQLNDNATLDQIICDYALSKLICAADESKDSCQCFATKTDTQHANKEMQIMKPFAKVGFLKNKPRKMEDRHIVYEDYGDLYGLIGQDKHKSFYQFYGVFDGHSGSLAATYAATHLPFLLAQQLKDRVLSKKASISKDHAEFCHDNHQNDEEAYREAFETAFLQVDKKFGSKNLTSGTTAVCALLHHDPDDNRLHLCIAWVGDSKALLVSPKVALQLVKPHKPDTPEERKRIESSESGGTVLFVQGQWRVNGILNVARTIGDITLGSSVIAEPDFIDISLPTNSHDFLVLATDGLWDHVSETKIVDTIYQALGDPTKNLDDIPKLLIDLAKQGDSQDNITIIVVFLKERSSFLTDTSANLS